MTIFALADFGSTFTKVSVVDGASGRRLGAAQHATTINSDVMEGFVKARDTALAGAGLGAVDRTLAASSAAGGLRMVAVGLIDDLTAAAAHQSALGAGAKVTAVFHGSLVQRDSQRVRESLPDLILFAGGTDGGERKRVAANARVVAAARTPAAVVVACNRDVAGEVAGIFEKEGHQTLVVPNVMPTVHRQQPEAARRAIRELFIRRVVHAKGLSRARAFFEAVVMPTPAAVLACAELVAAGTPERPGSGSAVVLDVGGATTDVHSVIAPAPSAAATGRARPSPLPAVRTVEGDLGVRWSADAVLALDEAWLVQRLGLSVDRLRVAVAARQADPALIPRNEEEREIDRALAASCLSLGVARHVGRISTRYVPGEGAEVVVHGRDLREVATLLATGGSLARDPLGARTTIMTALRRLDRGQPAPRAPEVVIDRGYISSAAGLLATVDRGAAGSLLRNEGLFRPDRLASDD